MLAGELRHLLASAPASAALLVFVRRVGAPEPEVVEVSEVLDVSSEDAVVIYIDLAE